MISKKRTVVFLIIDICLMSLLVWLDQFTKTVVKASLQGNEPLSLIGDFVTFRYLENTGAAFSILQNRRIFFLIVGTLFVVVIIFFLVLIPPTKKYLPLRGGLCFLGAGAVGNMIDRFFLHYVVDFISVGTFPVFNVADIYVTVSTAFLIILVLFVYKDDDLDFKKARHPKLHSSMLPPEENPDSGSEKS
ncbi:MAG: signal peptidase II [Lachnospiraceae bacterium]|nr:signal peptidase II [Lachnospiraceae bacterium]